MPSFFVFKIYFYKICKRFKGIFLNFSNNICINVLRGWLMNHIFYINKECLEVFISDTSSTEDDERLAKALNFMINSGLKVTLKGFDKYKRAIVEINGVIHTVDKGDSLGLRQRFITANHKIAFVEDPERYNKIIEYLK